MLQNNNIQRFLRCESTTPKLVRAATFDRVGYSVWASLTEVQSARRPGMHRSRNL